MACVRKRSHQRDQIRVGVWRHNPRDSCGSFGARWPGHRTNGAATLLAPTTSFVLRLYSRHFGDTSVACASATGRATILGIHVRGDRSLEVTQSLLPIPDSAASGQLDRWEYGHLLRPVDKEHLAGAAGCGND